jgi:hypothetical protein
VSQLSPQATKQASKYVIRDVMYVVYCMGYVVWDMLYVVCVCWEQGQQETPWREHTTLFSNLAFSKQASNSTIAQYKIA